MQRVDTCVSRASGDGWQDVCTNGVYQKMTGKCRTLVNESSGN